MKRSAKMTVNANVSSEARVRLVEPSGQAVSHFDFADCAPLQGDKLAHEVRWKGNLGAVRGRPIHVEFSLDNAKLYAFDLNT